MKTLLILTSAVVMASPVMAKDIAWTHFIEAGEDATSTYYYFYLSNGLSVERVRSVWNGGAQNAPVVTEYIFGSGKISIRHLVGKRDAIPALVAGKEAELELKKEYDIGVKNSSSMLVPPAPDKDLTAGQRMDLASLIYLLAKDRKALADKP